MQFWFGIPQYLVVDSPCPGSYQIDIPNQGHIQKKDCSRLSDQVIQTGYDWIWEKKGVAWKRIAIAE